MGSTSQEIQSEISKGEFNTFHFTAPMCVSQLTKQRVDEIILLTQQKPVFCIYSITHFHWVLFYVTKQDDRLTLLYKDSFGHSNETLETLFQQRIAPNTLFNFVHHPGSEESEEGTNSGILAIENMRIMIRELKTNQEFVDNFAAFPNFCSLEKAVTLREEFSTCYVRGVLQRLIDEKKQIEQIKQIKLHHQPEIDELEHRLCRLSDKIIYNLGVNGAFDKHKERNAIGIEIGLEEGFHLDNGEYRYNYRLLRSIDINVEELVSHLFNINFLSIGGENFRIVDGVLVLPNQEIDIPKRNKLTSFASTSRPQPNLEELYDRLNIVTDDQRDQVQSILGLT